MSPSLVCCLFIALFAGSGVAGALYGCFLMTAFRNAFRSSPCAVNCREKFLSNRAERRNLAPPHAPSHANKLDVRGSVARVVITSKAPSSPCSQDDAGSRSVPATAAGNCKVAPVETASLQHPSSDSPRGTVSPGDGETSRSPKSPAGGKPSSPGHGTSEPQHPLNHGLVLRVGESRTAVAGVAGGFVEKSGSRLDRLKHLAYY